MNETNLIKSNPSSVTSSFSLPTFSKSKRKSISILNILLSPNNKITKKVTSLSKRPKDNSKSTQKNNKNSKTSNSSFTSFFNERTQIQSPLTTKSFTIRRIAFNKCIPKKDTDLFKASVSFIKPKKCSISDEIIEISKTGLPKETDCLDYKGIKKSPKPNIKLFSIISPKKKIKNYLPKERGINDSRSPEGYLRRVYSPIEKYQHKLSSHHLNAIQREIVVQYSSVFSLIQKNKFTDKHRISYDLININTQKEEKKAKKRVSEMKVKEDISNILIAKYNKERVIKQRQLLQKFKLVIIRAAIHFQKLNISIEDFYNKQYSNIKPFEEKENDMLIHEIKMKNVDKAIQMIKKNKYLVLYFDHFKQTPLHWAAKRNLYQIICLMISKGANVNAKDSSGRTPLHIAAQSNHLEALQMLLYGSANPFVTNNDRNMAIDLTNSASIRFILQRTALLHAVNKMGKAKDYESRIKAGLDYLFDDELKTNFSSKKYLFENT